MKSYIFKILMFFMVAVSFNTTAGVISWVDWTGVVNTSPTSQVVGNLNVNGSNVDVTFNGAYLFAQVSGGTNYWLPDSPYLSNTVSNPPSNSDIIALSQGGKKTITFSSSIRNPIIALVSWENNIVNFDEDVEIKYFSSGCGYFGCGQFGNQSSSSFVGVGQLHGAIQLIGDFSSITFTDTYEWWHGFTIGIESLTPPALLPEPASLLLIGLGVFGLSVVVRRKNTHRM